MKKSYYFAAMDECLSAIVEAINSKRECANYCRTADAYIDQETGKPKQWAEEQAANYDALADEMEKILHSKFNV